MEIYLADNARGDCHIDAARMGAPKRERDEKAKIAAVAARIAKKVRGSEDAYDKVMQKRDEKQNDALSRPVITEVGLVPDPGTFKLFAAEMATWHDRKYESWGDGFDFKAVCCVHSGRLQAAKGPEKEKVRQEVTPSMRANLIRIIGRYHSHVLPARGGADASTAAATASTAAAAASTAAATD